MLEVAPTKDGSEKMPARAKKIGLYMFAKRNNNKKKNLTPVAHIHQEAPASPCKEMCSPYLPIP